MISEIIPLVQMGIYLLLAIMIGLVGLYIFLMKSRNTNQTNSRINIEYKNGNFQTFENNYKEYEASAEKEKEDPIQNL